MSGPEDETTGLNQNLVERIGGEDHVRFLAEASEILAGSLDYETELERVAHLIVPALADWCAVDLLADDGCLQRLAVVHRDPAKAETASKRRPTLEVGTTFIPRFNCWNNIGVSASGAAATGGMSSSHPMFAAHRCASAVRYGRRMAASPPGRGTYLR